MKKIFAIVMAVMMVIALVTVVCAADAAEDNEELPPTEGAPSGDADGDPGFELTTDKIIAYIQEHLEEISVIITLILTIFYNMRKHNLLNKSIGTLNNNAVAVAENSSASINQALAQMSGSSAVVGEYTNSISALLAEVRANAEEKKQLQTMLANVQYYLDTAKQANVEFSNELAELIVLSNIPNAKKDEFYARHRAAIDALNAVVPVLVQEEVTADEGNEA
jgi:hypothetical protein